MRCKLTLKFTDVIKEFAKPKVFPLEDKIVNGKKGLGLITWLGSIETYIPMG